MRRNRDETRRTCEKVACIRYYRRAVRQSYLEIASSSRLGVENERVGLRLLHVRDERRRVVLRLRGARASAQACAQLFAQPPALAH
eukprot:6177918-Pleurochrysis_carterae.AAC.1